MAGDEDHDTEDLPEPIDKIDFGALRRAFGSLHLFDDDRLPANAGVSPGYRR
jgi:hypothetical protein